MASTFQNLIFLRNLEKSFNKDGNFDNSQDSNPSSNKRGFRKETQFKAAAKKLRGQGESSSMGEGVYVDDYQNRKLGRVGQPYPKSEGSEEKDDTKKEGTKSTNLVDLADDKNFDFTSFNKKIQNI